MTTTATTDTTAAEQFHAQGYLGPYALCDPERMATTRAQIERLLESEGTSQLGRNHNRHLDSRIVYDLASAPAIVERMAAIYGPDLLLWRTNFFVKEPGAKEIPWHQDFNYWPLEPPVIISAWIAIDPATVENSCVQVIAGSHRTVIPHVPAGDEMQFGIMADPEQVDPGQAIDIEMQPGEFILFNERTLHHSEANRSQRRRIGLAVRVVVPMVRVLDWDSPNHGLMRLCGDDRLGFNRLAEPPTA